MNTGGVGGRFLRRHDTTVGEKYVGNIGNGGGRGHGLLWKGRMIVSVNVSDVSFLLPNSQTSSAARRWSLASS